MGLFFTGKGDKGFSIIGKKKIAKDSAIVMALGDLDELNSLVGLVRSQAKTEKLKNCLLFVQENLFIIQAQVAYLMYPRFKAPQFKAEKIQELEKEIEGMERKINPSRGFIISGENTLSSWLDYARTVARRAERSVVALVKKKKVSQEVLAYLNRLSSYLYVNARMVSQNAGVKEKKPHYL